jgi:hypothetical protein
MLLAFQTKTSEVLEKFLKDFEEPSNPFMQVIHSVMFTNKKITRIDDIVIIEQQSLFGLIGKYAMLPSAVLFFLGYVTGYNWMLGTGAVLLLLSIMMLSRYYLLLNIFIKLKISGHKNSIEYVGDGFLLNKLLLERQDGTTRSV